MGYLLCKIDIVPLFLVDLFLAVSWRLVLLLKDSIQILYSKAILLIEIYIQYTIM